jgi:predicted Co/Zn/Cd cation transporter (cation efflux family)
MVSCLQWGIYLEYYNKHVFINEMDALSWIGSTWLAMAVILGPVYGFVVYKVGYTWLLVGAVVCNTVALMMASVSDQVTCMTKLICGPACTYQASYRFGNSC